MYKSLIKPFLSDIKNFVLDTLFPIHCLVCEKEGTHICHDCRLLLKTVDHQRCIVCQKPSAFGLTHPNCQSPFTADQLINFYDYHDDNISKLIITGKYHFVKDIYTIFGQMIAQKLKTDYPNLLEANSYKLIAIPLHNWRQRWRGFNQAEILCQSISKELNLPVMEALIRTKSTKTQKDLKKDSRKKNVVGAFALSPSPLARGDVPPARQSLGDGGSATEGRERLAQIRDKNFILVDDVTTTGATLLEAAQVLKRNGAKKVVCLTVARD